MKNEIDQNCYIMVPQKKFGMLQQKNSNNENAGKLIEIKGVLHDN